MLAELFKHPRALLLSLFLHGLIIGVMVLNLTFIDRPKQIQADKVAKTVKAEVVDVQQLEERQKQKELEEQRKKEAEQKKIEEKK